MVFHQSEYEDAGLAQLWNNKLYHKLHIWMDSDLCEAFHEQLEILSGKMTFDNTDIWMVFHQSEYEDAGLT